MSVITSAGSVSGSTLNRFRRRARTSWVGVASVMIVLLVALVVIGGPEALAGAAQPARSAVVHYAPPVNAPVIDPFRPPSTFAGAGNRGLEYGTVGGEVVLASAAGTVTFAGPLGSASFVTLQHADGIRTSYSFVHELQVLVGQEVSAGAVLARADPGFHFGVRIGSTYLDPALLLMPVPMVSQPALLVPVTLAAPI